MCEIPFSSLSKYNPICTIQVDDNRKTIPLNNFYLHIHHAPFSLSTSAVQPFAKAGLANRSYVWHL